MLNDSPNLSSTKQQKKMLRNFNFFSHGFFKFYKIIKKFWSQISIILSIHWPSLGSCKVLQRDQARLVQPFRRLTVINIQKPNQIIYINQFYVRNIKNLNKFCFVWLRLICFSPVRVQRKIRISGKNTIFHSFFMIWPHFSEIISFLYYMCFILQS